MNFVLRKIANCILVVALFLNFLPITLVMASTPESNNERTGLIENLEELSDKFNEVIVELKEWTDKHSEELSSIISLRFLESLYKEINARNMEGTIDVFVNALTTETEVSNDLKLIKPKVVDIYNESYSLKDDIRNFIEREKNNITIEKALPLLQGNLDILFNVIKLFDSLSDVYSDSIIGGIDIELLIMDEFQEEIEQVLRLANRVITRGEDTLENKLDNIKNDSVKTEEQKINEIYNILYKMETAKTKGLEFYDEAYSQINNQMFKNKVKEHENSMLENIDRPISIVRIYLLTNFSVQKVNDVIGEEEGNNIIEEVYGVNVTPNPHVSLNRNNRRLVSSTPINNVSELTSILSNQNGSFVYDNLVNDRIATGSTLSINNGNEDVITYTFVVKGDILGRATTDITDLFRLIDASLGDMPLTGIYEEAADMNDDGILDISDIIQLIDTILSN